jgi:F0F1-type ATP synthase epsilon subunit
MSESLSSKNQLLLERLRSIYNFEHDETGAICEEAADEIERLRAALVYACFAQHKTPQYQLPRGITLIGANTVEVTVDGFTVRAENQSECLREAAPADETSEKQASPPQQLFNALQQDSAKEESKTP